MGMEGWVGGGEKWGGWAVEGGMGGGECTKQCHCGGPAGGAGGGGGVC